MRRALGVVALACTALCGCGIDRAACCRVNGAAERMGQDVPAAPGPDIQLLAFAGCHNAPAMRENLRAALDSVGDHRPFREVDRDALPKADPRRGWPSPTVLVDGRDLFGMPAPLTEGAGCRVYEGGVPQAARIAERLRGLRSAEPAAR